MSINKPLILVSNDDGFDAVGICSLVEMIGDMGEIIVCAPDSARSGFSRAFSATVPLRLTRRHNMGEVEVWSTNGTPVDCVKLAVDELCGGRTPDLVIGGINHGDNSTVNNHYSGTMGVAVEGCIKGIPSVAFSNCDYNSQSSQTHLTHYVRRVVERVLAEGLPKGVCLNVNFPDRGGSAAPSSRLSLLLDGGPLPQCRARCPGHRPVGTCPRLCGCYPHHH